MRPPNGAEKPDKVAYRTKAGENTSSKANLVTYY